MIRAVLHWTNLYYISEWVFWRIMLAYLPPKRSPAAARGWLLLIFLFPWHGLILYAAIGRPYLPRRRLELQQRISKMIRVAQAARGAQDVVPAEGLPPPLDE